MEKGVLLCALDDKQQERRRDGSNKMGSTAVMGDGDHGVSKIQIDGGWRRHFHVEKPRPARE